VGLLADIAEAMRLAGVNILAISAYERDGGAKFLMVTSDNAKATEALADLGGDIREKSIRDRRHAEHAGALEVAARKIADAGSTSSTRMGRAGAADMATVVFKTADDEQAARLLA